MTDALAKATIITLMAVILFMLVMFGGKLAIDRDDFIEKNVISLLESAGFENVKVYDSSEITPTFWKIGKGKPLWSVATALFWTWKLVTAGLSMRRTVRETILVIAACTKPTMKTQ